MNVKEAYKEWSEQYDTNENKTRDLEAISLRENLANISFRHCLEIGCGTGKNTEWLVNQGKRITAIDLTVEMLNVAKTKVNNPNVEFLNVDINQEWNFVNDKYDLVICSLVLEHIENIDRIIRLISENLTEDGILYISELHPFKQYLGSKAKYNTEEGEKTVTAFIHPISEFTDAAKKYNLQITALNEYFDNNDKTSVPRVLTLQFIKI